MSPGGPVKKQGPGRDRLPSFPWQAGSQLGVSQGCQCPASGQTAVQDSCPSSRPLTAHGRMKPGFTVLGVRALRIRQAQRSHTLSWEHMCLTQVQTQIHRHTRANTPNFTHETAQSTSDWGPTTLPECPSAFASGRCPLSSSWWEVRLASTEALCTLVSAWLRDESVMGTPFWNHFSVPLPYFWASCPV